MPPHPTIPDHLSGVGGPDVHSLLCFCAEVTGGCRCAPAGPWEPARGGLGSGPAGRGWRRLRNGQGGFPEENLGARKQGGDEVWKGREKKGKERSERKERRGERREIGRCLGLLVVAS